MKKKLIVVLVCVLCVAVGIISGLLLGGRKKDSKGLLDGVVDEKSFLDAHTVEEILKPAGDLVTQRYFYSDVDTFENHKEVFGAKLPLTTDKIIFSYSGVISAGITLKDVKFDVNNLERKITVQLPPPRIVSNEIDEETFTTYEIKNSIFTETKLKEYSELIGGLKQDKAEQLIRDEEFMNSVRDEAKKVITGFLQASGLADDYKILFE